MIDRAIEAVCSSCKVLKPASEFYVGKKRKNGLTGRCKDCHRAYMRDFAKTEKDLINHRKRQAEFIKKKPERDAIYRQAQTVELEKACIRCGRDDVRLVRHHPDYSKPKDVLTLCDKCHRAVHKELLNV